LTKEGPSARKTKARCSTQTGRAGADSFSPRLVIDRGRFARVRIPRRTECAKFSGQTNSVHPKEPAQENGEKGEPNQARHKGRRAQDLLERPNSRKTRGANGPFQPRIGEMRGGRVDVVKAIWERGQRGTCSRPKGGEGGVCFNVGLGNPRWGAPALRKALNRPIQGRWGAPGTETSPVHASTQEGLGGPVLFEIGKGSLWGKSGCASEKKGQKHSANLRQGGVPSLKKTPSSVKVGLSAGPEGRTGEVCGGKGLKKFGPAPKILKGFRLLTLRRLACLKKPHARRRGWSLGVMNPVELMITGPEGIRLSVPNCGKNTGKPHRRGRRDGDHSGPCPAKGLA